MTLLPSLKASTTIWPRLWSSKMHRPPSSSFPAFVSFAFGIVLMAYKDDTDNARAMSAAIFMTAASALALLSLPRRWWSCCCPRCCSLSRRCRRLCCRYLLCLAMLLPPATARLPFECSAAKSNCTAVDAAGKRQRADLASCCRT